MHRRTVLAGGSLFVGSAVAGCLDVIRSEETQRRAAACSHAPDDASDSSYETTMLAHTGVSFSTAESAADSTGSTDETSFVCARSADEAETVFGLDQLEEDDEGHASIITFVSETDYETAVMLGWQVTTRSLGYQVDVAGIEQMDESIHAYTCTYHDAAQT